MNITPTPPHKIPNSKTVRFTRLKKLPVRTMDWIGSVTSLVVHTIFFSVVFALRLLGISWDTILLVLTTAVSLEAIYLAIFIQMAVNKTTQSLQDVEEDIEEIQKDVDEIAEDVEDLGEGMEEMQEDIDEITEEDIDGQTHEKQTNIVLNNIESQLQMLVKEVEILKNSNRSDNRQL